MAQHFVVGLFSRNSLVRLSQAPSWTIPEVGTAPCLSRRAGGSIKELALTFRFRIMARCGVDVPIVGRRHRNDLIRVSLELAESLPRPAL
ncbi:hypothetical protein NOVOSPHI9U_260049 [Novosphingobium sp. 9U]|nr:hypothetical protein NOVOSPHI9U_260049 [Novosphingobium sp. 9U]